MLLLLLAEQLFGLTVAEPSDPGFFQQALPNAVAMLSLYWVLLALAAQRIRDMGLAPLPCIAALIVLELLEYAVLPRLTHARLPEPLETMTLPGGLLSIGAMLWLLFWPGATDRAPSSARPDPGRRSGASPRPPA